jgi:cell division protein ZapE
MNLKKLFLNHCKKNNLEINPNQLKLVDQLNDFYNLNFNKSFLKKFFSKKNTKPGFIYKVMSVSVKL